MSGIGAGFAALSTVKKLGIGLLVILALVGMVLLYGSSRYSAGYDKGEAETDAKWVEASEKLKAKAAASATKADDAAAARLEEEVASVAADQEKIDEANRNGTSPLDALFGD